MSGSRQSSVRPPPAARPLAALGTLPLVALPLVALPLALSSVVLGGCDVGGYGCKVYGQPELLGTGGADDPRSCGTCGHVCALPGVERHRCADGECGVGRCGDGYFDVDERDDTGCECRGPSRDDCVPCIADEILGDALDNDCDLRIDESVDPADEPPYTAAELFDHWPPYTARPNGSYGGLDFRGLRTITDAPAATRALCGEGTCEALYPGLDVDCVRGADGVPTCRPVFPIEPGERPDPDAFPESGAPDGRGRVGNKAYDACGDGIDQDGNGVIDDGLGCRTLVASAASPACHGRKGVAGCPPAAVALPEIFPGPLLPSGDPVGGVAYVTRDVWMDLSEANEAQFARYLTDTAQCGRIGGYDHPLCGLLDDADPTQPATGLSWCDAYDYCRWAGKRLPTEVEWLRAYAGPDVFTRVNKVDLCAGDGAPQHVSCGGVGAAPTDRVAGAVVRGTAERQTTSTHVRGNLAEWVFDAEVDPCTLDWVVCDESGAPTHAAEVPLDPVWYGASDDPGQRRVLRGGGWDSETEVVESGGRLLAYPGTGGHHYGVRCAESYAPGALASAGAAPYEDRARAREHVPCVGAMTSRVVRSGGNRLTWRAASACVVRPPMLGSAAPNVHASHLLDLWTDALADRVMPFIMQIEHGLPSTAGADEGAVTLIQAGVGVDAGSEVFWQRKYPPSSFLTDSCTESGCDFQGDGQPLNLHVGFLLSSVFDLMGGYSALVHTQPETCLEDSSDGVTWRFEMSFGVDELDRVLFGADDPIAEACSVARCLDPIESGTCSPTCTRWSFPVDVRMVRFRRP